MGRAAGGVAHTSEQPGERLVVPSAIAVKRQAPWFDVKDWGSWDAAGYFYHVGRSDEVIIRVTCRLAQAGRAPRDLA